MAPLTREQENELLKSLGLNKPQRETLRLGASLSLGSTADYALVSGKDPQNLYAPIRSLTDWRAAPSDEAGLLQSHVMGATKSRAARHWLPEQSRNLMDAVRPDWHAEFLRAQLLERLPLVENVYPAMAELQDALGTLRDNRWSQSQSHDWITRLEKGWVVGFYSGVLEKVAHLVERFNNYNAELFDDIAIPQYPRFAGQGFSPELVEYTRVHRPRAHPSMVVIFVPDLWQVELVSRAVRRSLGPTPVQIRCIATGQTYGDTTPGPSCDDVPQVARPRDMGGWSWEDRLRSSLWADGHVPRAFDLLHLAAQWPGQRPEFARILLGLGDESQEAHRSLRLLYQRGYMSRTGSVIDPMYWMNNRALDILAKLDRVSFGDIHGGVLNRHRGKILTTHDAEAMEIVARWAALGAPVAPGYREYHVWGGGAIDPDAMIYLSESPYGPGWKYMEHERSARRRFRLADKLGHYTSDRRRNRWPLLLSLWDDEAERIAQEFAAPLGCPLLTTTMERLRSGAPIQECWQMYGLPVRLGFEEVHVDGLVNLAR